VPAVLLSSVDCIRQPQPDSGGAVWAYATGHRQAIVAASGARAPRGGDGLQRRARRDDQRHRPQRRGARAAG